MTKTEIKKLKQQILGLNWDSNVKRAKAVNLTNLLMKEAQKHARFTRADYSAFFKSRGITPEPSWLSRL